MKRACAWCKKEMGEDGHNTEGQTDGICKPCLFYHFPVYYERLYGDKPLEKEGEKCQNTILK